MTMQRTAMSAAIHIAAYQGRIDVAKLLAANGADLNLRHRISLPIVLCNSE